MLLSIIVQVYNERHTLGTILGIVARTLPNVSKEVIVVDDCSSAHRHISISAPPIAALSFSILSLVCFLVNLCLCALAAMPVLLLGNDGDIVALIAGAGLVAALLSKFARGKYRVSSR